MLHKYILLGTIRQATEGELPSAFLPANEIWSTQKVLNLTWILLPASAIILISVKGA